MNQIHMLRNKACVSVNVCFRAPVLGPAVIPINSVCNDFLMQQCTLFSSVMFVLCNASAARKEMQTKL
jgi:hypothetical protein